jgi:hypothetical protein
MMLVLVLDGKKIEFDSYTVVKSENITNVHILHTPHNEDLVKSMNISPHKNYTY